MSVDTWRWMMLIWIFFFTISAINVRWEFKDNQVIGAFILGVVCMVLGGVRAPLLVVGMLLGSAATLFVLAVGWSGKQL